MARATYQLVMPDLFRAYRSVVKTYGAAVTTSHYTPIFSSYSIS
jgi:hypothetical protein